MPEAVVLVVLVGLGWSFSAWEGKCGCCCGAEEEASFFASASSAAVTIGCGGGRSSSAIPKLDSLIECVASEGGVVVEGAAATKEEEGDDEAPPPAVPDRPRAAKVVVGTNSTLLGFTLRCAILLPCAKNTAHATRWNISLASGSCNGPCVRTRSRREIGGPAASSDTK